MNVSPAPNHEEQVSTLIDLHSWAVVGVSQDPRKYGHRVFLSLLEAGYCVAGVNPKGGEVAGRAVFASLADLADVPEVVVTVVPPAVTERVVTLCGELGIGHIWMQPGSESEAAIAEALRLGMAVVSNDCAMVRRKQWPDEC